LYPPLPIQGTEVNPPKILSCCDTMTVKVGPFPLHLEWKVEASKPSWLPRQSSWYVTFDFAASATHVSRSGPSENFLIIALVPKTVWLLAQSQIYYLHFEGRAFIVE
jgi:hypothetical protein